MDRFDINFYKKSCYYLLNYRFLSKFLPELFAVNFDLKKSLSLNFSDEKEYSENMTQVLAFSKKSKLFLKEFIAKDSKEHKVLLSKERIDYDESIIEQNQKNIFSYPDCCMRNMYEKLAPISDIQITGKRYLVKNVQEDSFDFVMNPFLDLTPFHLYSHQPCSLDCKNTKDYSKELLKIIEKYNKDYHDDLVCFLKNPVFYTDILGQAIIFEGKYSYLNDTQSIEYGSFFSQVNIEDINLKSKSGYSEENIVLFEKILDLLRQSRKISLINNQLMFFLKNGTEFQLKKPDVLNWKFLDFI